MSGPGALFHLLVAIAVPLAAFATGLRATEPLWLWKRPRLLGRALLAVLVVVPLVAVLLANVLSPANAIVQAGIVVSILAIGIGPPALLGRTRATREVVSYEVGLNITLMILAVVYLPLTVAIHGAVFHHELSLPWWRVAQVVLLQALLPLLGGMAVARWLPRVAARLERYAPQLVGGAVLVLVLMALVMMWRSLTDLGADAWMICLVIAAVAIVIGHAAGGPSRQTRVVLASFSAMRFPALALLLASIAPRGTALIPVVIAYLLCSSLLVGLYGLVSARRRFSK